MPIFKNEGPDTKMIKRENGDFIKIRPGTEIQLNESEYLALTADPGTLPTTDEIEQVAEESEALIAGDNLKQIAEPAQEKNNTRLKFKTKYNKGRK